MVVKVDVQHVYRYPLEMVAKAHFSKYPTEKEKFVKRIEVLESVVTKGVSFCRRLAICDNVIPILLRQIQILDEQNITLEEVSWFDLRKRKLTTQSHNVTWSKYADLREKSVFYPCPNNPQWTQLEQHGTVQVNGLGLFGRVIEVFAEKFLQAGVQRGIRVMEDILHEKLNQVQQSDPVPNNLC